MVTLACQVSALGFPKTSQNVSLFLRLRSLSYYPTGCPKKMCTPKYIISGLIANSRAHPAFYAMSTHQRHSKHFCCSELSTRAACSPQASCLALQLTLHGLPNCRAHHDRALCKWRCACAGAAAGQRARVRARAPAQRVGARGPGAAVPFSQALSHGRPPPGEPFATSYKSLRLRDLRQVDSNEDTPVTRCTRTEITAQCLGGLVLALLYPLVRRWLVIAYRLVSGVHLRHVCS